MIDIKQILGKHSPIIGAAYEHPELLSGSINGKLLESAIKEIIEKVLEQAAKNAEIIETNLGNQTAKSRNIFSEGGVYKIDKQSILDTIKQIEF